MRAPDRPVKPIESEAPHMRNSRPTTGQPNPSSTALAPLAHVWDALDHRRQTQAGVAELADAHGSGPCVLRDVEVQVLSPAFSL